MDGSQKKQNYADVIYGQSFSLNTHTYKYSGVQMLSIIIYAQSYWSGFCRLLRLALGPGNISRQIGGGSPLAWCRLVRALWTGEGRTKYCIPILHSTGLWCMVVLASCPSVHLTLVLNWNPGHEDSVLIFNPTQSYLLYQPLHYRHFLEKVIPN